MGEITYISIESEGNYFDAGEQIVVRDRKFLDRGRSTDEFLTRGRTRKLNSPTNVEVYPTSSYLPDASGNLRSILSTGINHYASSSVVAYRTGVEITCEDDWVAGIVKISAGTPGHIVDRTSLGVSENHLISPNFFTELDNFSSINFVSSGGDPLHQTYPIVIGGDNLDDMNGVVEPFPIRSVLSGKSIYFPSEPHGTRGSLGDGNTDTKGGTESIVNVYTPLEFTPAPFLDNSHPITLDDGNETVSLGIMGVVNPTIKSLSPFNEIQLSGDSIGTTYLHKGEVTSPVGWDWDGSIRGADSIAFGGRAATRGSKRLGSRTLLNERDSKPFISDGNLFNDTNIIIFDDVITDVMTDDPSNPDPTVVIHTYVKQTAPTYVIQYPEMLPVGYVYTNEDGSRHTLVDNINGIKISRGTKPGLIVWNLS
jgi:hypothetical protein